MPVVTTIPDSPLSAFFACSVSNFFFKMLDSFALSSNSLLSKKSGPTKKDVSFLFFTIGFLILLLISSNGSWNTKMPSNFPSIKIPLPINEFTWLFDAA